jgi:hypothetical protein
MIDRFIDIPLLVYLPLPRKTRETAFMDIFLLPCCTNRVHAVFGRCSSPKVNERLQRRVQGRDPAGEYRERFEALRERCGKTFNPRKADWAISNSGPA